ncbi:hypothetical protein HID58_006654 [Brassica napus]|uniref:Uncharacterized protein n=1 Tax=Brassica napus TaxID=3708 RepID=A0ABQ8EBZ8_BRANA|nr:hypothetical protein HID58_006654 [Brassica napus]
MIQTLQLKTLILPRSKIKYEKQRRSRKRKNLRRCQRSEKPDTLSSWRCQRCYSPPPRPSRKTKPPAPVEPKPIRRENDGDENLSAVRDEP